MVAHRGRGHPRGRGMRGGMFRGRGSFRGRGGGRGNFNGQGRNSVFIPFQPFDLELCQSHFPKVANTETTVSQDIKDFICTGASIRSDSWPPIRSDKWDLIWGAWMNPTRPLICQFVRFFLGKILKFQKLRILVGFVVNFVKWRYIRPNCQNLGSFFFRKPQNWGSTCGAFLRDIRKRVFAGRREMSGACARPPLVLKFSPCPEIFPDMMIMKLHYSRYEVFNLPSHQCA